MLILIFILSEYAIDNKCIYLLLISFSCKQANHLLKYQKQTFFITFFKKWFNYIY